MNTEYTYYKGFYLRFHMPKLFFTDDYGNSRMVDWYGYWYGYPYGLESTEYYGSTF